MRKKNLINTLCFVALFSVSATAQQVVGNGKIATNQRNVGRFNQINSNGSMDLVLNQGNKAAIEVVADENIQDLIITETVNNQLNISVKKGSGFTTKNKVEVHVYNQSIEKITLNGSGDLKGNGPFEFGELKLDMNGSGDAEMQANINKLDISANGSGEVELKGNFNSIVCSGNGSGDFELSGSATSLDYMANGSGNLDAFGLKTNTANIKIMGSGDAKVNVDNAITADIEGSGNVIFKGNPANKTVNRKGSGEFKKAD